MHKEFDAIRLQIDDRVARLILGRPPVNAFNDALIGELTKAVDQVEQQSGLSVLHIRSNLDAFCAGADLQFR